MGRTNSAYTSIPQQKALAIVPKVSSILSLAGSLYIIYDVLWRIPKKKRRLYHRILLGMSISDTLASAAWFCSTWPTNPNVLNIWGAAGTQGTCTLQGFFAQTPLATVVYSGWLAIYYYLVIRCGWSHHHLTRCKIEYWIHPSAVLLGLATAIASVALGILNPLGFTCWIAAVPLGCDETWLTGRTTCTRGDNSKLYQWLFWYVPLWLVILLVTFIMSSIVWKFYVQERQNNLYRRRAVGGSKKQSAVLRKWSHSKLRDIVWQSIFYVGSFYLTWIFPTILRIEQNTDDVVWYHWEMLTAAFVPSQGLWNVLIYLRPQFIKHRDVRRKKMQGRKRLNLGTVSASVDDAIMHEAQTTTKINCSSAQDEGDNAGAAVGQPTRVSFLQHSDKTKAYEIPQHSMPEENAPRRPMLRKEESRFKATAALMDWFRDAKDVLLLGDAGLHHNYFDDSNVMGTMSSVDEFHSGGFVHDEGEEDEKDGGDLDNNTVGHAISTLVPGELGPLADQDEPSDLATSITPVQSAQYPFPASASASSLKQSKVSRFEDDPEPSQSSFFGFVQRNEPPPI